mgnify:FL=1
MIVVYGNGFLGNRLAEHLGGRIDPRIITEQSQLEEGPVQYVAQEAAQESSMNL